MCARIWETISACSVSKPGQRLTQRGDLLVQLARGEVGEPPRVGGPRDERVEHRAAGGAEDVCGDAG